MNRCILAHQNHEWIPNSKNMVWIISPQNQKFDYSLFKGEKLQDLPKGLINYGNWYYATTDFLDFHCNVFHPEHKKNGGDTSFKLHNSLFYSENPDYYLALIDTKNYSRFRVLDQAEYALEDEWFTTGKKMEVEELFEKAQKKLNVSSDTKLEEETYTNYKQTSYGNFSTVITLIGFFFGLMLLLTIMYMVPSNPYI